MDLHIKDRIYIPQILPQQNNLKEFYLKRSVFEKVAITEEDRKNYNIQEDKENGRITWDVEKDKTPLTVSFSEDEINYLKGACEKLVDMNYPDDFWNVVEKIYDAANN